jgi:lipopolysaccharide export system permease protein
MDIRRKRPTLSLVAGMFSRDIPGYSILVRKTFERSSDIEGVTLFDHTDPGVSVVVTAARGSISFSQDYRKLIMDLHDGEIHTVDLREIQRYRRLRFVRHRIAMDVEGFDFERTAAGTFLRSDRELSAQAMLTIVDSLAVHRVEIHTTIRAAVERDMEALLGGAPPPSAFPRYGAVPQPRKDRATLHARQMSGLVENEALRLEGIEGQMNQYLVEVHKKYSIPAACMVFVLIGVPLGVMARRGGFGVAATLSLGFFLLYWAFLIGGEKLADRRLLSPPVGMWSANVLLTCVGVYLTARIGRESTVIRWDALQRIIPRRWRTALPDEIREAAPDV